MSEQTASQAWQNRSSPPAAWSRLRDYAARDTNVVVVSVVLNNLLRAVSGMVLTRLLVPEVFGISGVIASVQFTVALATDLGFQAFVVRQENGEDKRFLDTVWTVSLIRSLLLALAVAVLAVPLSRTFGKPELAPLIAASGLTFVIEGLASTSLLTALRHRLILRLSALELVVLIVQIAASAALAWAWGNYWAILVGLFISGLLKTVLSYAVFAGSRRWFRLDRETLHALWKFARYVTGSSIIFLLISQCDKLVLAKLMPLDQFGFYILAGNLASAPLAFAANYASRVLYPAYAQAWRDGTDDLRHRFYEKRRLPALLYGFAAGGVIGSAPMIVSVLYDDRYAAAAGYLQILCISSLLALPSNAANEALTATGRISATLEASVVKLVWLTVAGFAGYLVLGQIGLVLAVGLMEAPALVVKWLRLRLAGLLDMREELLFLAVGLAGVGSGWLGTILIGPLLV
ncbi:MAG: teichoic acid transporter [Novosphingobium lindaniclasticum]|jgi:O-antigen/teichoic acid export membrane protein|uniref:oligosaccharide flippase family protein n=1 Tax=Novosphingobium lindaniclasticum TaxID=1329895 RepID=UPI002409B1C9|nr:oligosaccharide flippase family protein [Novosphingobium lindaniclasticum]MDF2638775.1 teichoic acid transporter [Novosphingobium lindaniclasticum]